MKEDLREGQLREEQAMDRSQWRGVVQRCELMPKWETTSTEKEEDNIPIKGRMIIHHHAHLNLN